jgi:hypothetical protein
VSGLVLTPPYTHPLNVRATLKEKGFALLPAADVAQLAGCSAQALLALNGFWDRLAPDRYLKDGGRYRSRRHGSCVISGGDVCSVPHRAHWQPLDYNALHGGMQRWFEPLEDALFLGAISALLVWLGGLCDAMRGPQKWFAEVHQFRIDTAGGMGRPTPEGAHRDGVDLVAVFLVARQKIKGGETRVFEADGPHGQRFTLTEPWSVLLLDDARMIHETTAIVPLAQQLGFRDTLVVTLRSGGFQDAVAV